MRIYSLSLQNFRNYKETSFEANPGLNIFIGKNAQGKTSLLEAIYLLSTAKSWRAGRDAELIHWNADCARIAGRISRELRGDVDIEVVICRPDKKEVRVNTIRQARLAGIMGELNTVLIEPHDVDIVRGEPNLRRRFLNIEISQVQPQYCYLLINYKRVLEQRNRLLKDLQLKGSMNGVLDALTQQLVAYGARIIERRLQFVERLGSLARAVHSRITDGSESLEVRYVSSIRLDGRRGESEIQESFMEALCAGRSEELRRGSTLVGPHKDDLLFTVNGVNARVYGSQGQQRTIALSLRLAEVEVMKEVAKEPPVVLLDDVMTDLDEERRDHIFEMTAGQCQTFLTTASTRVLDDSILASGAMYRIVDGQVLPG
jgi:DNA replication and repair protein RecF